ncbi:protein of unknown function [Sterolibacterium denitrificans]|uniref:Cobalt ABC transporter permease n=1 Tax=Sterolibacterium denitrificans TaxID=157592 RepID=A0A7Z7MVJ2_9PROT|nr:DUF2523 family protein [Sterolibacterium denitrificans]SMB27276.1 protein of unknown function [Sterolibacterium denitrificans]
MNWAEWLTYGISGWVLKGAMALGFGVVTYTGWDFVKDQLETAVSSSLGSMNATVYQLMALAGFVDAIGVWLAAFTAAVTLLSFKKLAFMGSGS